MSEWIGRFNIALAILGMMAAFGSLNKMRWRETRPCVMLAMLLIAVGLAGQWAGQVGLGWANFADTATFGGILVLLIASQKVPSWFLERWANPIALLLGIICGLVFLTSILMAPS